MTAEPTVIPATTASVDWEFAARFGGKLAPSGPKVGAIEAATAVEELRRDAAIAGDHVREFTGLVAPPGTVPGPVLVIDRAGWVQANAETFAVLIQPVLDRVVGEAARRRTPPGRMLGAAGAKLAGAEAGGLLSFLSGKVLGQFDPFHGETGRLMLVAPNVVQIERELEVDPTDFRLWVCLHEETHRVQFTANPWLRRHLLDQIAELVSSMDVTGQIEEAVRRAVASLRGGSGAGLIDLISTPAQREVLDRVTGVMSLLEGHADVVMDDVGPGVIPSVAEIRRAFAKRRQGTGSVDRLVRRLLGLEAKMAQYRDGARFVRHVLDAAGMEAFNTVWTGPETLPGKEEILDPDLWIARVLRG